MSPTTSNTDFTESDFPDLSIEDHVHLQRQFAIHGHDRVISWLRANVAIPLTLRLAEAPDTDDYYEALAEYYIDTE